MAAERREEDWTEEDMEQLTANPCSDCAIDQPTHKDCFECPAPGEDEARRALARAEAHDKEQPPDKAPEDYVREEQERRSK